MFKFKIDPADVAKTQSLIEKRFQKVCSDPAMLSVQGKFLSERIRFQARTTKPLSVGGKLPALQPITVEQRRYLAKYNRTDPTFDASRSNLTLTGAFLNSLGFDVSGPGEITLSFKGEHPGYKTDKGGPKGKQPTNAQLSLYLKDKGFSVFDVQTLNSNKAILSRMTAIVKAYLRRSLKLE